MTEMNSVTIQKNKRYEFRMAKVLCACFALKHKKAGSEGDSLPVFFPLCFVRHVPGFSDIRADKISASPGF